MAEHWSENIKIEMKNSLSNQIAKKKDFNKKSVVISKYLVGGFKYGPRVRIRSLFFSNWNTNSELGIFHIPSDGNRLENIHSTLNSIDTRFRPSLHCNFPSNFFLHPK